MNQEANQIPSVRLDNGVTILGVEKPAGEQVSEGQRQTPENLVSPPAPNTPVRQAREAVAEAENSSVGTTPNFEGPSTTIPNTVYHETTPTTQPTATTTTPETSTTIPRYSTTLPPKTRETLPTISEFPDTEPGHPDLNPKPGE